jgi:3-deoxy-D-manno-octulosonic acid (KDO) 8-phosphate synthase
MILLILLLFNQTDLINNITRTQREIQILNLINGLELSKSQMDFILEKAQETE